jgi:hypothetical protein
MYCIVGKDNKHILFYSIILYYIILYYIILYYIIFYSILFNWNGLILTRFLGTTAWTQMAVYLFTYRS